MKKRSRITPAGAGKTYRCPSGFSAHEDHPRRCGENLNPTGRNFTIQGSPPQVRGKPPLRRHCKPHIQDHPRRCGENMQRQTSTALAQGSPPQVRGKQWEQRKPIYIPRITPAGAGKTYCRAYHCANQQDHPRRCGENAYQHILSPLLAGSPPQVRGKHIYDGCKIIVIRITPAGAGKTFIITFTYHFI